MPPDDATRTSATELLDRYVSGGAFSGGALAIWRNGAIVCDHYSGDVAPDLPSGAGVLWPIASISKVYTAAAIMRLVEEGAVTLGTPVSAIVPEFTGGGRESVRLRHLLTHTSGMMYESPEMAARLDAQTPLSELVDEALASQLLFEPGTSLRYADYNYLLAGHVAERITGRALPELVRSLVLEPAGLAGTRMPPMRNDDDRIAHVRGALGEGTHGDMYNSRYARDLAHPAFGVFATTRDLVRFGSTFMPGGERFLSEGSVRAMTTDQTGGVPGVHPSMQGYAADVRVPWAIGFALQTASVPGLYSDLSSFQTFGHGGATGCALVCDPACGIAVAVTTNTHLRTGRETWTRRIHSILNCVFASAG